MRHAMRRYVTDPTTGKRYAIPAGGSSDNVPTGDDGTRDGSGDDGSTSGGDDTGGNSDDGTRDGSADADGKGKGKGKASDPDELRADVARERRKRQEAQRELEELRRQSESDQDRIRREAREEALEPARRMARRNAVTDLAREAGFVDPSDAYAALAADGKLDAIEVDVDELTVVDVEALADELRQLADRKRHLLTADARAALEGRTSSDTNGSSIDGQQQQQGAPPDPLTTFGRILAGGR